MIPEHVVAIAFVEQSSIGTGPFPPYLTAPHAAYLCIARTCSLSLSLSLTLSLSLSLFPSLPPSIGGLRAGCKRCQRPACATRGADAGFQ